MITALREEMSRQEIASKEAQDFTNALFKRIKTSARYYDAFMTNRSIEEYEDIQVVLLDGAIKGCLDHANLYYTIANAVLNKLKVDAKTVFVMSEKTTTWYERRIGPASAFLFTVRLHYRLFTQDKPSA
jgi:hypothetical protein